MGLGGVGWGGGRAEPSSQGARFLEAEEEARTPDAAETCPYTKKRKVRVNPPKKRGEDPRRSRDLPERKEKKSSLQPPQKNSSAEAKRGAVCVCVCVLCVWKRREVLEARSLGGYHGAPHTAAIARQQACSWKRKDMQHTRLEAGRGTLLHYSRLAAGKGKLLH